MRNKQRSQVMRRLLDNARYEVLPTASAEAAVVEHAPVGHTITVTASPAKGLEATLDLCERLTGHGYHAVPHLAARMVNGRAELAEICERLVARGVDTVFAPAGDAEPGAGAYQSAVDLLEDLTALGSPFQHVGVTGYPESHPSIGDDLTVQAMWDKRRYATQIVSNLCFDANVVGRWVRRMRDRGITLPLLVGMPGPVERTKLLSMATKIGVGESTKFLAKNTSVFTRIATPGGWRPERFLEKAAPTLGDPTALVTGLHLFTFNQVAETEAWRRRLLTELGAAPVAG
ncbi:MAG: methylenetetrahydrofolate reductase [Nocardioidaceae bacterium]|jgi:methylenetetrahydrofolate reductase (NADPH)|nr:methylenetetrahydrofolate reductase [Nocardioidaceae bacterium]